MKEQVKKNPLKKVIDRIQSKFGEEAVITKNLPVPRFSSGSPLVDEVLGGGWAIGRIHEIFGMESSSKTTLAIHACVEMQKTGKAVGYVDTEQAMDPDYMLALGLDMSEDKFIFSQPSSAEQALEIVREMCGESVIGLVILDSVAGLVPTALLQGEAGDAHVGLVARLMSSQMTILKNVCKESGCTLICINQLRDKIGGGFGFAGGGKTTPGGHALKFYSTQRLELAKVGGDKEGDETVANRVKVSCKKNKVAPPFKKCEIIVRFGQGLDRMQEILDEAIKLGVIQKIKRGYYGYEGNELGRGLPGLREALRNDKPLFEEISQKTLEARNTFPIEPIKEEEEEEDENS